MKLVVGLGNPGVEYENTRHNTGFVVLEAFRKKCFPDGVWKNNDKFNAEVIILKDCFKDTPSSKEYPFDKIILLRPLTFMNDSGSAALKASSFYKINSNDILVIHDDLDIALGECKLQKGKGAAGHHGVESVIEKLETKDFWRLRIGIDGALRQKVNDDAKFVLEKFSKEEKLILENVIDKAVESIRLFMLGGD